MESSASGIALRPFRVKSTGQRFQPGEKVEAPPEKLLAWVAKGLVMIETGQLFSNGKPTGALLDDPSHIRLFAWCLSNLHFSPVSGATDVSKAAAECRLTIQEAREAFGKLLQEGDLRVERARRGGKDVFYLAPIRW